MTEGELPKRVESAAIQRVLAQIEQVAPTPATVLLLGETGTGKEVMAQAIHDLSPRRQRPMIGVSCAAIPTSLIESELFGREKGAYTGALSRQIGRFEAANQSTLFLDEIGDLPMEVQVKLLRVLQERVIERLGSTQPIKVDVRIIAATNRNLEDAVRDKTFREDLFYRLNVFPVVVPPLRERVEDIPALVVELHRRVLEIVRQDDRVDFEGEPARAAALLLAGERPRAAQRHRTRGHPGNRPLSSWWRRRGSTNGRCPRTAMTLTELEVEPHPRRSQEHQLARPRIRRRGGASGPQADNAREPDGQTRHRAHESWWAAWGRVVIDSGLFVGTLRHRRFTPVAHAFTYPLFMVLLDIDRVPELMHVSAVTSYNRWNWAWDLYLGSCEATFLERHTGLFQLVLLKNGAQRVLFNDPRSEAAARTAVCTAGL